MPSLEIRVVRESAPLLKKHADDYRCRRAARVSIWLTSRSEFRTPSQASAQQQQQPLLKHVANTVQVNAAQCTASATVTSRCFQRQRLSIDEWHSCARRDCSDASCLLRCCITANSPKRQHPSAGCSTVESPGWHSVPHHRAINTLHLLELRLSTPCRLGTATCCANPACG